MIQRRIYILYRTDNALEVESASVKSNGKGRTGIFLIPLILQLQQCRVVLSPLGTSKE